MILLWISHLIVWRPRYLSVSCYHIVAISSVHSHMTIQITWLRKAAKTRWNMKKKKQWKWTDRKIKLRKVRKKKTQISIGDMLSVSFIPAHTACKCNDARELVSINCIYLHALYEFGMRGCYLNGQKKKRVTAKCAVQTAPTTTKENTSLSYRNKHNLHWYGFSPLCIRRCFVSVELSEKAFLQALHLFEMKRK